MISALVLASCVGPAIGPARASCAGPALFVDGHEGPAIVERIPAGSTVTVVGVRFARGCNDVASPCTGGGGFSDPIEEIQVELVPAEWRSRTDWYDTWRSTGPPISLGTYDADGDFGFTIEGVTLPTTPGTYVLTATGDVQSFPAQTPLELG